jgi:hypothetical protein
MDELAVRRERNRKAAQDAAAKTKSKSNVSAHDRTGSKGVKAHDRKLTPAEKTQLIAKEMLQQDRDSEGKKFPKSKQGLDRYIEGKRQTIAETKNQIENLKAQKQELEKSRQQKISKVEQLLKESDDRLQAIRAKREALEKEIAERNAKKFAEEALKDGW